MDNHLKKPPFTVTTTTTNSINDNDYGSESENDNTPYTTAPSTPLTTYLSPPRHHPYSSFFFSAPTTPIHYSVSSTTTSAAVTTTAVALPSVISDASSFEFEFSGAEPEISAADELFLNGKIRPINDVSEEGEDDERRSRDVKLQSSGSRSQRRRTRSMSPLRNTPPFDWITPSSTVNTPEKDEVATVETTPSSSRCSSAGRSSKRWLFLKEFLRSKSEGRSNNKFWSNINISFSPTKETPSKNRNGNTKETRSSSKNNKKTEIKIAGKRRSAHEIHYEKKRAEVEEMRKKTYLPYKQGLLGGCLGFNSKTYVTLDRFANSLNPLSTS